MGSIEGYEKGSFPGSWFLEKSCVAVIIGHHIPDRYDAPALLDVAAPTEEDWKFLKRRAHIINGGLRQPSANAWRQAILETFAWGQMHNRDQDDGC